MTQLERRKELYFKWKAAGLGTAIKLDTASPAFDVLIECAYELYSTNLCRTCGSAAYTYWKLVNKWMEQNAERNGWDIEEPVQPVITSESTTQPKTTKNGKKK